MKLILLLGAFIAILIGFAVPLRGIETDYLEVVVQAKVDGFPQLPPGNALDQHIVDFRQKWGSKLGDITFDEIAALSIVIGDYELESSPLYLGIMLPLFGIWLMTATLVSRTYKNLYALGFESPGVSSTWVFVTCLVPVVAFVVPWWAFYQTIRIASERPEKDRTPLLLLRTRFIGIGWGLANAWLWLMNPVAIFLFFPVRNIDGWIRRLESTESMLGLIAVPLIATWLFMATLVLMQNRIYQKRERVAGAYS